MPCFYPGIQGGKGFRIQLPAFFGSGSRSAVFETGRLKCLAFQTAQFGVYPLVMTNIAIENGDL